PASSLYAWTRPRVYGSRFSSRTRDGSRPGRRNGPAAAASRVAAGRRPTSSALSTPTPRAPASQPTRSTTSWSPTRSTSITLELTGVDPPLELRGASAAEERRSPTGADLAVQEDGEAELRADPPSEFQRRVARTRHVLRANRDEWDDIRGAHPWMDALVLPEV